MPAHNRCISGSSGNPCGSGCGGWRSYVRIILDHTTLYPGVAETLERMRGVRMAVLTNKPEGPSRTILQGLRAASYFSGLVGGDTHKFKKPDPRTIRVLMDRFEAAPERTLMVGDTSVDIQTARAAGARVHRVVWIRVPGGPVCGRVHNRRVPAAPRNCVIV